MTSRLRPPDRKSTRLNSSHLGISYAVFCLKNRSDRKSTRLNSSHLGISHAVFCLKKILVAEATRANLVVDHVLHSRPPTKYGGRAPRELTPCFLFFF